MSGLPHQPVTNALVVVSNLIHPFISQVQQLIFDRQRLQTWIAFDIDHLLARIPESNDFETESCCWFIFL